VGGKKRNVLGHQLQKEILEIGNYTEKENQFVAEKVFLTCRKKEGEVICSGVGIAARRLETERLSI